MSIENISNRLLEATLIGYYYYYCLAIGLSKHEYSFKMTCVSHLMILDKKIVLI